MSKTMKALVKAKAEPGLWMEDVAVPEPGINDVLIKIDRSAICGTDVHIYNWDKWAQDHIGVPLVVGHEFAGTVVAVGMNVHDYKEGDVVSGEGHLVCGVCRNCLAGRRHLCARPEGVGIDRAGAYAEYLCIPQGNVWYADQSMSKDLLSCFDPFGNAAHCALSFPMTGEDILITGAGPIGLMATAIARHIAARHVVVTDVNPYRLDLARKMGATLAIDARTSSIANAQEELGMKEGFDIGLEMSGNPLAFADMLANMAHGGKVAMLGIQPAGTGINWDLVIFNSLNIKGIYGREMFETWYKMTMMIQTGLDLTPVITHRFPIDKFEDGFEVMRSGNCGKVVLEWN
jgi:threonine 3-dehydrogenase